MTADDKRGILKSLVAGIRVTPAIRRGSNVFDPRRVTIVYRLESMAKVQGVRNRWRGKDGHIHIVGGFFRVTDEGVNCSTLAR
jgi:hypothetical protein